MGHMAIGDIHIQWTNVDPNIIRDARHLFLGDIKKILNCN